MAKAKKKPAPKSWADRLPKTKTIRVTAADIRDGVPVSIRECAVALACGRAFGVEPHRISVTTSFFRVFAAGLGWPRQVVYSLPARVSDFISKFDNPETRRRCRPFSFVARKAV